MTTVYLVTSGEYSDYGVDGAFSTREKAVAWINGEDDDYEIEEYDIDPEIHPGRFEFCAEFQNGSLISLDNYIKHWHHPKPWPSVRRACGRIEVVFVAQNKAHARKHAPEILAQWLAEHREPL